jgi:hypothetical protein
MAEAFMVIPLRCSSSIESRYRIVPASRSEMIPLDAIKLSASVVLLKEQNRGKQKKERRKVDGYKPNMLWDEENDDISTANLTHDRHERR